jgi:hypothetical protein
LFLVGDLPWFLGSGALPVQNGRGPQPFFGQAAGDVVVIGRSMVAFGDFSNQVCLFLCKFRCRFEDAIE